MRARSIVAFGLAISLFALTLHLFFRFLYLLGFPDGFIAELDGAEAQLVTVFNWVSVLTGAWFVYLGIVGFRHNISRRLFLGCIAYLAAAAVAIAIDVYLRAHLMDSRGG